MEFYYNFASIWASERILLILLLLSLILVVIMMIYFLAISNDTEDSNILNPCLISAYLLQGIWRILDTNLKKNLFHSVADTNE
jgi:heme/copper-type cytochrome/quinol oxidase subunit 4